ncbi:MAG: hypothetical protein NC906_05310 [Candidatus Omnitrophica bacterium]|nr:hypothetical protein [Candidatus Omnitrophota bacterium]
MKPLRYFICLFLVSSLYGDGFYIVKNPFNFPVEKVPVVIPINENKDFVFYDTNNKKMILTQKDIFPDGKIELVGLIDLLPGEVKRIEIREFSGASVPDLLKTVYDENKKIYAFSNGCYRFFLSFRKDGRKDWEDIYHVVCSDFMYLQDNTGTGVKQISNPQLGVFNGVPNVSIMNGPFRLQIILKGKGELRYSTSKIPGDLQLCITLYANKPVFDTETIFIPDEDGSLYLVAAGETLVSASEQDRWNLYSRSHRTDEDISINFGVTERVSVEGTKWVSAIGSNRAFSYVHDDINSNVSTSKGEGGIERSKVVFRLSNFSEKSNYIRPDFFNITTKKGEPLKLKMRITFYPSLQAEKIFGLNDYNIFQTDFLIPRAVKNIFKFSGDVAISQKDIEKIKEILNTTDVFILAGDKVNDANLGLLKELSTKWHVPILTACDISQFLNNQYQRNDCKNLVIILVGSPEENLVVRAHNKKYGFVDAYFPGERKGVISVVENFLDTGRYLIYIGGEDPAAVKKSIEYFVKKFNPPKVDDLQVRVISPELRPRPWMIREKIESISIPVCRNETQPVHLLLYAPSEIKDLELVCDIKNSQGEKIGYQLSYIPWSFAGVDKDGNVYPEGIQSAHFEGHPLPHVTFIPGSVKRENTEIPFITYMANHDAMWDGLPPRIPSRRQVSIWIDFKIEKGLALGNYEGEIKIRWNKKEKKIPIRIDIFDIELPTGWQMDFFPMYGLDNYNENVFKLYLGIDKNDEEAYLNAIKRLGTLLISHGATIANISAYDMKIKFFPDGVIKIEPNELNRVIDAYREGGFNGWFEMGLHPHYWEPMVEMISNFKKVSIEEARRIFFEKLKEWMRDKGIEGKLIARVGDEPGDADKWVEMAAKLKGSGFLITVAHNQTKEEFTRKMVGTIDIWCPLWNRAITGWMGEILPDDEPSRFNRNFFNERKQAGEIIWNYTCATPYFSLTRLPTEIYFYFWDSYNKKFDGVVYYGGGNWCHMWGGDTLPGVKGHIAHRDYYVYNVYGKNSRHDWVGGTTIFYPDARLKEVISSQRFEIVKQAQEDVKLFSLIRGKFGDQTLNNLLSSVVSPRNHNDIPPEDFHKVRETAIKMLLNIK